MGTSQLIKVQFIFLGLCYLSTGLPTEGSYRLPLEVMPFSYSIQLVPYLLEGDAPRHFTFDGNVSILVRAERAESSITLHMSDIRLHNSPVVIEENSGKSVNITDMTTDIQREFLVLHLATALAKGETYRLSFSYTGNLQTEILGFFRLYYDDGATRRWLAGTQFEQLGARRAFPCFDEPALKATFNVSIARLPTMISLSNMPLQRTDGPDPTLDGRMWDIFQTSVKMSTYLVAFVVSDFKALELGIYRVWAEPKTVQQGNFSLYYSPKVIAVMENITGIPYALPKVDQVAIEHFPGGMENWGLIIYNVNALLAPEDYYEEMVATTVSHELSHQWFGDLVTFDWWKYTWLNEGFATFFEYFATDQIFPAWGEADTLTASVQFYIMEDDSDGTSHPLSADVETPQEIATMFDMISYSKGGSILKMLAHSITFDTFYKGLRFYLRARAFSTAVADDLFAGLQQAVDEDGELLEGPSVKDIMDTWTLQSGYPVITVTRDYGAGTASIQQKQFFDTPGEKSSNSSWFVPISYTTSLDPQFNNTRPGLWLAPHDNLTVQNLPGEDQWIIFNIQAMGYFRINYDAHNWKLLTDQLKADKDKIHQLNRDQIKEDSRYFVQAGLLDWDTAMGITDYLRLETDPAPWMAGLRELQWFYDKLGGSPMFPALQSYYIKLMDRFYKTVGIEHRAKDSHLVRKVRPLLLHWACLLGHEDCLQSSVQNVIRMRQGTTNRKIHPGLYCAVMRHDGDLFWEWLWNIYQGTADIQERQEVLRSLGCTSSTKLLKRLLYLTITEGSGLKPEDRVNVFSATCNGQDAVSCDVTLQFIASHFPQLANQFGGYETMSSILVRIASRLRTQEQVDMLQYIVNKNRKVMAADKGMTSSALRIAQENVDWLKTKGGGLVKWLSEHHSVKN